MEIDYIFLEKDKKAKSKDNVEKDLEHIVLWGKYLAYAVSFGNAKKITKKYKELQDLNISEKFFDLKIEIEVK